MKRILIIVAILLAAVAIVVMGVLLRGGTTSTPNPSGGSLPASGSLPTPGTGNSGSNSGSSQNTTGNNNTNNNNNSNGTSTLPNEEIVMVSQLAALDYAINPQLGLVIVTPAGVVTTASSSPVTIAQANFGPVLGAWFSPDGKWLLVKSGDSGVYNWNLLDVYKKTWKNIAANTTEMYWSQTGNQLAYLARKTNGSTLTTFTPTTNSSKALLTLSAQDLVLAWGNPSHILLMDRPSSKLAGNVWDFSITANTLLPLVSNTAGAHILWGGVKSGGLLFKAGPTSGAMSIINSSGVALQNTTFLTLPSKCVFGETPTAATTSPNIVNYLFCGIPKDSSSFKAHKLPDDYAKGLVNTSDDFYAIDLSTGLQTPVLTKVNNNEIDVADPKIYGTDLYFLNRNDKKIYRESIAVFGKESTGDL